MLKVECPSCRAPYDVDERRLPPGGMKMKCPKCGNSFSVGPTGVIANAVAPVPAPAIPRPAPPRLSEPALLDDLDLEPMVSSAPPAKPVIPMVAPKKPVPPPAAMHAANGDLSVSNIDPGGGLPPQIVTKDEDWDLPAPRGAAKAPVNRKTPFDDWELDLPAPKGALPKPGTRELDDIALAPAPPAPVPVPAPVMPAPAPMVAKDTSISVDDLDLPMPKIGADLPAVKKKPLPDIKRPAIADGFGDLDLPIPKAAADLPAPKGGLGGPAFGARDFGEIDLPVARGEADLPMPRFEGAQSVDLPIPKGQADLPALGRGIDLLDPSEPEDISEADVTLSSSSSAENVEFGSRNLGGSEAGGDDLEFADLPQEEAGGEVPAANLGVDMAPRPVEKRAQAGKRDANKRSIALHVFLGTLGLAVVGGVVLGYTPYGFFGAYYLERFLPGAGDPSVVAAEISRAEKKAVSDSYKDISSSLTLLGAARHASGLNRQLLTRSLLHESLFQVRFGQEVHSAARAAAILARLDKRGRQAPGMDLALAADFLRRGRLNEASAAIERAHSADAKDAYVYLVQGEIALAKRQYDVAARAFEDALKRGGGARAQWGVARALMASKAAGVQEAIEATLRTNPRHAGAKLELARTAWAHGDAGDAMRFAKEVVGAVPVSGERVSAGVFERSAAWTLLGQIYTIQRNRRLAIGAFDRAIEADGYNADALLGSADALMEEHRYRDALSRFEAVMESLTRSQQLEEQAESFARAKLGAGKAMLQLDRPEDARASFAELHERHPNDANVLLWLGRAFEALGQKKEAEENYRAVIREDPTLFDGYLALAQLMLAAGRNTDAAAVLDDARTKVPETAQMRRALAESELQRNELNGAVREFRRALELDPKDHGNWFGLGVALRKLGQLDEAAQTFEHLASEDSSYPGLALERGMLFEAQGLSKEAVASYEAALKSKSGDPDLLLRLGASQVAAGEIDAAEKTLQRVQKDRPTSAEAEHFLGRVSFARRNLPEALARLDRAIQLDPTRAEFYAYLGWAALESGNISRAQQSVQTALERDSNLGDAHWLRGRIDLRTGAVRDALVELETSIRLNPKRAEAFADMGDSNEQLGKRREAAVAYEKAVELNKSEGEWWYRLGVLRRDTADPAGAATALARACVLGDLQAPPPGWLADAHRALGDTLRAKGERGGAIEHYRRYLALAPTGAVDREDVAQALVSLGTAP